MDDGHLAAWGQAPGRKAPTSGSVHGELAERIARRFGDLGVTPADVCAAMGWSSEDLVQADG